MAIVRNPSEGFYSVKNLFLRLLSRANQWFVLLVQFRVPPHPPPPPPAPTQLFIYITHEAVYNLLIVLGNFHSCSTTPCTDSLNPSTANERYCKIKKEGGVSGINRWALYSSTFPQFFYCFLKDPGPLNSKKRFSPA
jgi:hypothetical protein